VQLREAAFVRWVHEGMAFYRRVGQIKKEEGEITIEILQERGNELLKIFDECFGDREALELQRRYTRGLRTDMERLQADIP
jgi:hypothetical protein